MLAASAWAAGALNPAWYVNLVAKPEVVVRRAGAKATMIAEAAAPEERQRLYDRFKEASERYAGFETMTTREIPVVLLRESTA